MNRLVLNLGIAYMLVRLISRFWAYHNADWVYVVLTQRSYKFYEFYQSSEG